MRRLREGQWASLSPCQGNGRPIWCRVVAVGREAAALQPFAARPLDDWSRLDDCHLLFDAAGAPVALRGTISEPVPGDLRFSPSDGVQLGRRSASRLDASHPIEVVITAGGTVERLSTVTVNFSCDGMLVVDPGGIELGDWVVATFVPDGGEPLQADAIAVRRAAGNLGFAFRGLSASARERLNEHVIAEKRRDVAAALVRDAA